MLKKDKERLLKIASNYKKQAVKNYAEKGQQLDLNLFGNLKLIFGLKPTQAIEYFKKKKPELSEKYYDIWKDEHDKAFTIAGIASLDLLTDIQGKLQKAMEEGMTYKQFEEEFESSVLKKMGWTSDDKDIPPYRIQNIFRTNVGNSMCSGRWQNIEDNKGSRPYVMYHTLEDDAVRPAHALMDKKVFKIEDPVLNTHAPKSGYMCRCYLQSLTERDIKRKGLTVEDSSDGQIIEKEVTLNKKDDIKVKTTVYIDPKGNHIQIDPGWDWNPGKKNYIPNISKYPPKLRVIAEKLIKNIPVEVKEVKSAWENGIFKPEKIEKWKPLTENEKLIQKDYKLLCDTLIPELEKLTGDKLNLKELIIDSEKELGKKHLSPACGTYYHEEQKIVLNSSVVKRELEGARKWSYETDPIPLMIGTILHEGGHAITLQGKGKLPKWGIEKLDVVFLEEGTNELVTDVRYKTIIGKSSTSQAYTKIVGYMLFQLIDKYGMDKEVIYKELEKIRKPNTTLDEIDEFKKIFTNDQIGMRQGQWNNILENVKKNNPNLPDKIKENIDNYLKENTESKVIPITEESIKALSKEMEKLGYSREDIRKVTTAQIDTMLYQKSPEDFKNKFAEYDTKLMEDLKSWWKE